MIFTVPITGTAMNAVAATTPEIDASPTLQTLSSSDIRTLQDVGHHAEID
jgi:hypothetical protein